MVSHKDLINDPYKAMRELTESNRTRPGVAYAVNQNNVYDPAADTLYTAGPYAVQICTIYDQSISEALFGYGVYNTTTRLREAETRRLSSAQRLAEHMWEEDVEVEQAKQQLELFRKEARSKLT